MQNPEIARPIRFDISHDEEYWAYLALEYMLRKLRAFDTDLPLDAELFTVKSDRVAEAIEVLDALTSRLLMAGVDQRARERNEP